MTVLWMWTMSLAAGLVAAPIVALGATPVGLIDRDRVEWVEDLSEELANQLHDLSLAVRGRELPGMARHFAADLRATGWPSGPGAAEGRFKAVEEVGLDAGPRLDRAAFLDSWSSFLEGFSDLEDVRIKVKQARLEDGPPVRAEASLYLSIVGRDRAGRRSWLEARASIEAIRGVDAGAETETASWSLEDFSFTSFQLRRIGVDLFDEVAVPAGVYAAAPAFGSPGNPTFAAPGVALADVDADGLLDAFVAGHGRNFLYINQGDGTFFDRASQAGVQITPPASGSLLLDFDNDGDADLFLAARGLQMLFENRLVPDGQLAFADVSVATDVDRQAWAFSAVAGDVNGDGYPDIYVTSYNRYGVVMPDSWSMATNGTANLLFVNDGDGTFTEAGQAWGVADRRWSYAAVMADLSGDGRLDLYVANDFGENAYYVNQGGRFRDDAAERGMLDPGNGMGVSLGDFDNDGRVDLHVTNMSSTAGKRILGRLFPSESAHLDQTRVLAKLAAGNTLFRNLGSGAFQDVSAAVGPFSAGWAWGGGFVDLDNDGWEDLHAPNGFVSGESLKDT